MNVPQFPPDEFHGKEGRCLAKAFFQEEETLLRDIIS
jgi:hypothetical protein